MSNIIINSFHYKAQKKQVRIIVMTQENKMQDEVFTFQDKENKSQFRKTFFQDGVFISQGKEAIAWVASFYAIHDLGYRFFEKLLRIF